MLPLIIRELLLVLGLSLIGLVTILPQSVSAQDDAIPKEFEGLSAEQILDLVRMSQALQNHDLSSRLKKGRTLIPLGISMREGSIYFAFRDPDEILQLQLGEQKGSLMRQTRKGKGAVPANEYGTAIRGTDVTYEDLAMRFLYWPKPVRLKDDRLGLKIGKCWVIRVVNPDRRGPYQTVRIWVHQKSGALVKMEGYGWKASKYPIKRFKVTKGQRTKDGTWILKQMLVETTNPQNGRATSDTFLEVRDPKAAKN